MRSLELIHSLFKIFCSFELELRFCIFISDPAGLKAPQILSAIASSYEERARSIRRKQKQKDSLTSETVSLEKADVAKGDSPRGMI